MNKHEQFIDLKDQSKEGVKAFGCLIGFIFICIVAISLIVLFADKIDAISESFTNYINSL